MGILWVFICLFSAAPLGAYIMEIMRNSNENDMPELILGLSGWKIIVIYSSIKAARSK